MKIYDSVAGVKPPYTKAPDVQHGFSQILHDLLNLPDQSAYKMVDKLVESFGFDGGVDPDDMTLWSDAEIIECADKHYDFQSWLYDNHDELLDAALEAINYEKKVAK